MSDHFATQINSASPRPSENTSRERQTINTLPAVLKPGLPVPRVPKPFTIEPNIVELTGKDGKTSYRVQLRKTQNGRTKSFTRTFNSLPIARRWKKKTLSEFEVFGMDIANAEEQTVADIIDIRLRIRGDFGKSAKQTLTWLNISPIHYHG